MNEKLIRTIVLGNGLILEIYDYSRKLAGDRWLVKIVSKIDILEFVSNHVNITKSGKNYKGLCPFHKETSPSFSVSSELQIFNCFGCG